MAVIPEAKMAKAGILFLIHFMLMSSFCNLLNTSTPTSFSNILTYTYQSQHYHHLFSYPNPTANKMGC